MNKASNDSNVKLTPYLKLWKDNGILFCVYTNSLNIDLSIAKQCVADRLNFSENQDYPVCIDMRGLKSVTREARIFLSEKGTEKIKAGALIVGSPLTKILGNVFIYANKPSVPTKLFTDKNEAIEWLKKTCDLQ